MFVWARGLQWQSRRSQVHLVCAVCVLRGWHYRNHVSYTVSLITRSRNPNHEPAFSTSSSVWLDKRGPPTMLLRRLAPLAMPVAS